MKKIISILIWIFISQIVSGQRVFSKIDKISSKHEVEKFISSLKDRFEEFTLLADSLHSPSYSKADFDKNGLIDLLVIGTLPTYTIADDIIKGQEFLTLVVMDHGNDSLQMINLNKDPDFNLLLPKFVNDSLIMVDQRPLIYKFGDFIEFNPHPKTYNIEKIEFETTPCFGTCPVFSITINKDKAALFEASKYNSETEIPIIEILRKPAHSKEIKGVFRTVVRDDSYSNIMELLNYIDFPNLNDDYSVNWTDDQSCTLTITYNNGQKKIINDYGLIGTYGLERLYHLFFELRFNQKWK